MRIAHRAEYRAHASDRIERRLGAEQLPAIRSEWPPTYLVNEVTTRSAAEWARGVWYTAPSI